MTTTDDRARQQRKTLLDTWFDRSVISRQSARRLRQLLGPPADRRGLCVVAEDVLISSHLIQQGGDWSCVSVLEHPGLAAEAMAGPTLRLLREGKLPFPDSTFDVVLMDRVLEYFQEDRAFVAECHRVLKPSGIMVLSAAVAKRWSLIRLIRGLFRLGAKTPSRARPGYTESELFDVLKDGFDAEEVSVWSRFFSELAEIGIHVLTSLGGGQGVTDTADHGDSDRWLHQGRRVIRLLGLSYPIARAASALDALVFFTSGYRLAFRARRRAWRPRRAPSLRDGRSIADAAINTKIGTAAPF